MLDHVADRNEAHQLTIGDDRQVTEFSRRHAFHDAGARVVLAARRNLACHHLTNRQGKRWKDRKVADDAAAVDLTSLKYYTVKRGDTLATIARKLHVNRSDLAQANYLGLNSRVAPGEKLMVPHEAGVPLAARSARPVHSLQVMMKL